MLQRILDFSIRQRFVALSIVLLIAFVGFRAYQEIPINSLPDVTPVQVLVITKAGQYSPYDVERLVSFPIETAMNGLPNVKQVRSISQFGLSAVIIEFDEKTDIYFARQLVSQRLQSIVDELPLGVSSPQLGPISTALGEIYQYVVHGDGYDLTELREIQDWIIAPQLKTVPGVTEINSFGGFVKQYEVVVYPNKLRTYGIGLKEIVEAIEKNNSVSSGNYLEHNREQYIIRGFGLISNVEDIENIVVKKIGNAPIFIRDVAKVSIGKQIRQGAVTQNGKGEVVTGIVMMLRGGNGREVIKEIEKKISEINKTLPKGVRIEKFYDQSELIERTMKTVTTNLVEGGFLVIAVLLLMLGEIRGALIVAGVIPLSMLFAFIGMREFGFAANLMSLGAIDFGMIVDGSVVMVENIVHRLREKNGQNIFCTIREATFEVARPIFFGVLIILMVYVPIVTFQGMEGILYRPMAITVASAVLGALVFTLLYVPAASYLVFKKGFKIRRNFLVEWLKKYYQRFLSKFLERKLLLLVPAVLIFAFSLVILFNLGTEFLPELDEGSILVEQVRLPSVTLEESVRNANWFAAKLMENIPEIKTVVPKTGRSDLANDWMGVHQTDVWIILKPKDQWRPGVTKEDIIEQIEPFLKTEPGLSYNFTQPIAMRVDELTSGVKSDLAVKIFGENLDELNRIGEQIVKIASEQKGTDNVYLEQSVGQPYVTIKIDREAISRFALNVEDIQTLIEAGIGSKKASQVFVGQKRFDIVVTFPQELRNAIDKISELPVHLPNGDFIPLKRVAEIRVEEGAREVVRENGWRRAVVLINIKNIDIGTYVSQLQREIERKMQLPPGYFLTFGGSFENQRRAMQHLYVVVPLTILIIIGLMYVMFGQIRYPLLILVNLPFALTGGVLLLWARGMYLTIAASIGFIALFGVAVLNGIVLVSHLNTLRKGSTNFKELVIRGATDRLRPVLMTALVASLGFIPMAFNTGPGSEVQRPLATVVIGGLITSTILTLLILPTLYYWLDKNYKYNKEEEIQSQQTCE